MATFTDLERTEIAKEIARALDRAHTTYVSALVALKMRIIEESKQTEDLRKQFYGLMIDCVFCFMPVGRILTGMVSKLGSIKNATPLGAQVIDKITTMLADPNSPRFKQFEDATKEILKAASKIVPSDLMGVFEKNVEEDIKYVDCLEQAYNVYTFLLGSDIIKKALDRDAYPDEVLANLMNRWHPINNSLELNKELVNENFRLYREFISCFRESDATESFDNMKNGIEYRLTFFLQGANSANRSQVLLCREKTQYWITGSIKEGTRMQHIVPTISIIPASFAISSLMSAYENFKVTNHPIESPRRNQLRVGNLPSGKTLEEYARENRMTAILDQNGQFGTIWDRFAMRRFSLSVDQ